MAKVRVLVLRAAGTNCDQEACHAFGLAGAEAQTGHVNRLVENAALLREFQILTLPGGFSYGDDVAAGKILANQLVHHFRAAVREFIDAGKLMLGICNGFQVLVKAGLLPGISNCKLQTVNSQRGSAMENTRSEGRVGLCPTRSGEVGEVVDEGNVLPRVTITYNDSGKFEDRWVHLQPGTEKCVFITPGRRLYLPIAHGEGKVCFAEPETLAGVQAGGQVAFRYVDEKGRFGGYPINPNGSTDHIAGLCDPTGRVLGLMPHPERHVHRTHHPHWTRRAGDAGEPDGLSIFQNAVRYFA
jgi:phosphoribosylformylglycinamidine synthase subunit PurQ / glutaminase